MVLRKYNTVLNHFQVSIQKSTVTKVGGSVKTASSVLVLLWPSHAGISRATAASQQASQTRDFLTISLRTTHKHIRVVNYSGGQ